VYDTVIVGAGAAGLSAGIFASRLRLRTLIISKDVGGQALLAGSVENYPGIPRSDGWSIVERMLEQAQRFGAEIVIDEVTGISRSAEGFVIKALGGEYLARTVILASGKLPRDLGIPGEREFRGRGVSHCALCDGPLYRGKKVAVVGDGELAQSSALFLSKYAAVYLVTKEEMLTGRRELIEEIERAGNVQVVRGAVAREVRGREAVEALVVESEEGTRELLVDGVFVELGHASGADPFRGIVETDEKGQIIVNAKNETSTPGIFAAGDVTNVPFKQLVIAASEGAKAALSAYEYLAGPGRRAP